MALPIQDYLVLLLIGIALLCSMSNLPTVNGFIASSGSPSILGASLLANSPLFSPGGDDDDGGGNDESNDEFDGFNPFQPGSKMPTRGGFGILSDGERKRPSPPTTPGGRISPRQMRMKELTTDLLARLYDDEAVSKLLTSNEDFLLEQLDNPDAVLEPDSVYTPDMDREERYRRYREVMEDRIENARAPAAKKALGALKDFVLSRK